MLNTKESSLWLKQMYWYLNKKPGVYCQRVFAIDKDFEKVIQDNNEKLCTLEQYTYVKDLDIIIACIDNVMEYTTFLNILKNASIPMLASRRKDEYPFIILTGTAVYNPYPMSEFIDAYIYGNSMSVMDNILLKYNWWKRKKVEKSKFLEDIRDTNGIFVPKIKLDEGKICHLDNKIFMASFEDLNSEADITVEVIPNIKTKEDNIGVKLCRGCSKNCTDCAKRYIYGQATFLSSEKAVKKIDIATKYTGITDVGFDTSCYASYDNYYNLISQIKELNSPAVRNIYFGDVRLDLDNLWMLDYLKKYPSKYMYIPRIKVGGATSLQRKYLGLNLTDEQIEEISTQIYKKEYPAIVLEYTIGLPGEKKEDLLNILNLASKIANSFEKTCSKLPERYAVILDIKGFRAVPHTPSEYAPVNDAKTILEKHEFLRIALDNPYVYLNFENPVKHEVEALLLQGNENVPSIIHTVAKKQASLEYIPENFEQEIWKEAIEKSGIDIKEIFKEKPLDYVFNRDNILVSTSKGLLKEEYIKMKDYIKSGGVV